MVFKHWIWICLLAFSQATGAAVIEHWQTAQGARVYFVNAPSLPMVDVKVTFDAGSARDGAQFGLAALTLGMMEMGALDWDADEVARRFESVGAVFGNGLSKDTAWLSLRSLVDRHLLDKAMITFQTVLTRPRFNDTDFQREKNRTLAAIKQREESPANIASESYMKAVYGQHPYAHPEEGSLESVAALEVEDLKTFYQKHYVQANAIVVIVGDVKRHQAEQMANALMSGLTVGEKAAELPPVEVVAGGVEEHIEFPSAQTHILMGELGMARKDPDYFNLYLGNHILGGGMLVSRLFEEVREKRGLAYTASSQFSPMYRPGPFTISLQTRNDQSENALTVAKETLKRFVLEGPTEEEILAAKKNITGGFALRMDTNAKLTEYVSMIGFYQQPLDYLEMFPLKIQEVSKDSVRDAFKRRLVLDGLKVTTVGAKAGG